MLFFEIDKKSTYLNREPIMLYLEVFFKHKSLTQDTSLKGNK